MKKSQKKNQKNNPILLLVLVVAVVIIAVLIFKNITKAKGNPEQQTSQGRQVSSEGQTKIFNISEIEVVEQNVNLIIKDAQKQMELNVIDGEEFTINNMYGEHNFKVLEKTENSIKLSIANLAPLKTDNTINLDQKYDTITIKKDEGICLKEQVNDGFDEPIYIYYK